MFLSMCRNDSTGVLEQFQVDPLRNKPGWLTCRSLSRAILRCMAVPQNKGPHTEPPQNSNPYCGDPQGATPPPIYGGPHILAIPLMYLAVRLGPYLPPSRECWQAHMLAVYSNPLILYSLFRVSTLMSNIFHLKKYIT